MLDHAYETPEEEREREDIDAQWEHSAFAHHRGDDRLERSPFATTFADLPVQLRASVKHTPAVPPAAPGRASHITAGGQQHNHNSPKGA